MKSSLSLTLRRVVWVFAISYSRPAVGQRVQEICSASRRGANLQKLARGWHDPSTHVERLVTVAPQAQVSVLTWEGRAEGPPLIWIPGANSSSHVFDDIAPAMSHVGRQIGITPRGQRPSIPGSVVALTPREREQDVLTVLDSLHVRRAVFIGHSLAGDVLTALSVDHPERVAGLVYMDAAYDRLAPRPRVPRVFLTAHLAAAASTDRLRERCNASSPPSAAEITELLLFSGQPFAGPHSADSALARLRRSDRVDSLAMGLWPGIGRVPEPAAPVLFLYSETSGRDEFIQAAGLSHDPTLRAAYVSWWDSIVHPQLVHEQVLTSRAWPRAETITVPHSTHMIMWSDRSQLSQILDGFLNRSVESRLPD